MQGVAVAVIDVQQNEIVEHQNWVLANSSVSGNGVQVRPLSDVLPTEFA